MAHTAWKKFERRVARDHGVERQPVTGERDGSDAMPHPMFCFQMKLRKAIPKNIRAWSDSIYRAAQKAGKIGVLIVKEPGKYDDNALVILRYDDWVDLHGTAGAGGHVIELSPRDQEAFVKALLRPARAHKRLKEAAKRRGTVPEPQAVIVSTKAQS